VLVTLRSGGSLETASRILGLLSLLLRHRWREAVPLRYGSPLALLIRVWSRLVRIELTTHGAHLGNVEWLLVSVISSLRRRRV
jgi:hypothetical protein